MLLRIYLVISVFSTGLLFAQAKISNPDRETIGTVQQKSDAKAGAVDNSASAKAVLQNIAILEKNIALKVADLERLQTEAAEFNPDMKKEIRIVYEKPTNPIPGPSKYLVYRYVEYEFEGANKVKEIRVISRHRSLTEDMHSII